MKHPTSNLDSSTRFSLLVLIAPPKPQALLSAQVFLPAEKSHVQPPIRRNQPIGTARIGRIRMIDLALLSHAGANAGSSTLDKTAVARLLALHKEIIPLGLELVRVHVVVLNRRHVLVLRGVEIVVEVGAVRAHPRKCPAHALFVCGDLGDGRTRDTDKCRRARRQVRDRREVVGEEGAGGAARVPGWVEHEMVDDELRVRAEKVRERELGLLAGFRERCEGVGLGHFDDGERAALGGKGVAGAREVLLLFEEGQTGRAVLGGRYDLSRGLGEER